MHLQRLSWATTKCYVSITTKTAGIAGIFVMQLIFGTLHSDLGYLFEKLKEQSLRVFCICG